MITRANSLLEPWTLLKSMVESDDSVTAQDNSKKGFEQFLMVVGQSTDEYVTRSKGLVAVVIYGGVVVDAEEICRRILVDLFLNMDSVRDGFAFRVNHSLP